MDETNARDLDIERPLVVFAEAFECSKIWLRFHFLPDFSKNQDLVEDERALQNQDFY